MLITVGEPMAGGMKIRLKEEELMKQKSEKNAKSEKSEENEEDEENEERFLIVDLD